MTQHENRLKDAKSPYLLQHAKNPVDWYPWSDEALARAKREDKPILLSIGYAACHWCHVMERESFEDEEIAHQMNEGFVSIKVDREERPDLDQIYQLVVQLMGRSGGWPLTVFLTPDQRPFFAGTYFPPKDRHGLPGFPKLLSALLQSWRFRRKDIEQQAEELVSAMREVVSSPRTTGGGGRDAVAGDRAKPSEEAATDATGLPQPATSDLLRKASRKLLARFDPEHGGFGRRPKFPNTMSLEVLLRRGVLEGDDTCRDAVHRALVRMQEGGIWDQLRGGFHRYSTDERWLVPHFEKMLYDNALLLRLYVDGWRVFGEERFARTARGIIDYALAEMLSPEGAFYASQDADSEGHEGRFFVWTPIEVSQALEGDDLAQEAAVLHWGVTDEGNFEDTGSTVLSVHRPLAYVASALDKPAAEVEAAIERARGKLLEAREERQRPARDDKVLASWNALFIAALADAGVALGEPAWVAAAERALDTIASRLVTDGRVRRYLKDGAPAGDPKSGFLDDHAYLGCAALEVHGATGEPRHAELAVAIARKMIELFWDEEAGAFFFTPHDGEPLIARPKDAFDHAVPSGSSMAALLVSQLASVADESFGRFAERVIGDSARRAADEPFAFSHLVAVADRWARGSIDVVLVGDRDASADLREAIYARYLPDRTVITIDPKEPRSSEVARVAAEGKPAPDSGAFAYVCRARSCSAPVSDPKELTDLLR